jgi:hypothetical protein
VATLLRGDSVTFAVGNAGSLGAEPVNRRAFLRCALLAGTAAVLGGGAIIVDQLLSAVRHHVRIRAPTPRTVRRAVLSPPTTVAPEVHGVYADWVQQENARPSMAEWNVGNLGVRKAIEGYFDVVSANRDYVAHLVAESPVVNSVTTPAVAMRAMRPGLANSVNHRMPSRPDGQALRGGVRGETCRDPSGGDFGDGATRRDLRDPPGFASSMN